MQDFNGDGWPDLIWAKRVQGFTANIVELALNPRDGSFAPSEIIQTVSNLGSYAAFIVGYLDQDGKDDLIINSYYGTGSDLVNSQLDVFLDHAAGGFHTSQRIQPSRHEGFFNPVLIDLNGDGILDLFISVYASAGLKSHWHCSTLKDRLTEAFPRKRSLATDQVSVCFTTKKLMSMGMDERTFC